MTTLPFDVVVALDRSDATVAVAVFNLATGALLQAELSTAPEALEPWWRDLRATHRDARVAVAFEQPAPNLLAFFAARPPAAILPLNPSAIWAYRQLTVSRAHTDASDARDIARSSRCMPTSSRRGAPRRRVAAARHPGPGAPQMGRSAHRPHQSPAGPAQALFSAGAPTYA